jgi:sugar O-acyltransferase (sialic acid O-acetyltransferase NeuD family)
MTKRLQTDGNRTASKLERLYIVGAGGHGRVCSEIAEASGWTVAGFLDTRRFPEERVNDKPIPYCTLQELAAAGVHDGGAVFVAISANAGRLAVIEEAKRLGFSVATLAHPSAVVSRTCRIAEGTVLMAGVIVNANTRIERGCILNTACSVDHDSIMEDGVQIGPGAHAASTVHFGTQCFVGTGASIKQCVTIGSRAIVGAGTVVIRDVPDGLTVVGNPARIIPK